ncbi:hypothetical protein chiPu_0025535 [Chiloscyllium punctatum]|uniref:Uncharacterized protein n=1 Tax=Chiloscyllium punctatum TaxID=137246 RepID=A0A401TGR1_CHIPU|nr:hypothetical protein [Chiloscyllium punctatum]
MVWPRVPGASLCSGVPPTLNDDPFPPGPCRSAAGTQEAWARLTWGLPPLPGLPNDRERSSFPRVWSNRVLPAPASGQKAVSVPETGNAAASEGRDQRPA